jgi:hypothetical protein
MSFYSKKVEPSHKETPTNTDENSLTESGMLNNQEEEILIHKKADCSSKFKGGSWPYLGLP